MNIMPHACSRISQTSLAHYYIHIQRYIHIHTHDRKVGNALLHTAALPACGEPHAPCDPAPCSRSGAPGTWHGHERPQGVAQHPARRRHRHATTIAAATPRAYLEQHHRALFRERHCFVQHRKGSTHGVGDGGEGRGQCERPLVLGGLARPTIPRHGGPSARHGARAAGDRRAIVCGDKRKFSVDVTHFENWRP